MNSGSRPLRVVLVWHGEPLEERVFQSPQAITVGAAKGDTFIVPALACAAVVSLSILGIGWIFGGPADDALDLDPPPSTAIAKILLEPPKEPEPVEKPQPRKVREEDASKRAREKEGKVGNNDAKVAETKIPKGDKDQIVKKVSNVGLLGVVK